MVRLITGSWGDQLMMTPGAGISAAADTHNKEWRVVTVGISVERVVVTDIRVTGRLRKYF